MRSPAQAIVWEICAKNRWALLFAFGLIPFCAALAYVIGPGHELGRMLQVFGIIMTFGALILVCSYTADDSRGGFSGFPSWMYTLPLRTSALVLGPVLFGFALVVVTVFLWELSISIFWGVPFTLQYIAWHTLLASATLVSVQSLVWSLHRFRWMRVTALVLAIYGYFYVGAVSHVSEFAGGAGYWFGGVALATAVAIVGGIAGVERDRRGRWEGWTGKLIERVVDLIPRRSGAFTSPMRAQLWFEWRRKGFFVVIVCFAVPMALSLFLLPLGSALHLPPIETLFHFSWPFVLLIIVSGAIGGAVAKSDAWSSDPAIHVLVATRPLTTGALVFSKMKAAALMTALGWLGFALLWGPVVAISSRMGWENEEAARFWSDFPTDFPRLWQWISNPIVIVALFAVPWHLMVQTMAVALTGNKRRMALSAAQGIIVLAMVIFCTMWLYKHPDWLDPLFQFLPWFVAAMMVLKVIGTVCGFVAARRLVSQRDFLILLGLWTFMACLVIAAGLIADAAEGLPSALVWLLVLWQFFPAGEIPACVVSLTRNRHR